MKSDKKILIAFLLNFFFSVFEFIGGTITGSVAILSDAVHDIGDAASIGLSYFLERKSKKSPDDVYTYGYIRYSVIGSLITTVILIFGSLSVIYNSVCRFFYPVKINYDGMIIFAVIGVVVNFSAAWFTKGKESLNQSAVNLHMLEDVLGWAVVLVGGIIMRFTGISIIDPLMSVGVSLFIFINALKNLKTIENLFLEKIPSGINIEKLKEYICNIDGVKDAHHIHIWSIDGYNHCATMHIVTDTPSYKIKNEIKKELEKYGIVHITLELEGVDEICDKRCHIIANDTCGHHHHHHHHH